MTPRRLAAPPPDQGAENLPTREEKIKNKNNLQGITKGTYTPRSTPIARGSELEAYCSLLQANRLPKKRKRDVDLARSIVFSGFAMLRIRTEVACVEHRHEQNASDVPVRLELAALGETLLRCVRDNMQA